MPSERIQRQIDALLDEADAASRNRDWATVLARAESALAFDPESGDARAYLEAAQRQLETLSSQPSADATVPTRQALQLPDTFVGGRYRVERFLGEGGKKRV